MAVFSLVVDDKSECSGALHVVDRSSVISESNPIIGDVLGTEPYARQPLWKRGVLGNGDI